MYQTEKKSYIPWLIILCVFGILFYLCYVLSDILTPFIAGIILAYFLNPLATKLSTKMSRMLASLIIVVGTLILILIFIAFLIPVLLQQMHELIDKMPVVLNWIQDNGNRVNLPVSIQNKLDVLENKLNFREFFSSENLGQLWQQNSETFKSLIIKASDYAKQTGSGIILLLYNLFMLPITLLYFLYVWPELIAKLGSLIPRRYYKPVTEFMGELDTALTEFVRGQFLVMIVMGLIYGIGLALVGLKNGFAIGFMTGFLVFVPYLGFTVGSILATLAAILQYGDIWHLIGVWVVFGVGQTLESFIITPKLIGDRIGLSPVLVIFVLLAFGSLFGFTGMLLALPISAVCVVIVNAISDKYYKSDFYLEEE
ncbi:MAG: AI-2E family transporter [Neisseriaceae bacterium]|nr:AI-2E family transporter [Neisseriaceae bacterium]MCV2509006.1 AI-2E family transporter [Neisseriaceae bacterium]